MSETVGEAYIRILADGSRLSRSIRDEWKKADPAIKGQGKRSGSLFAQEFDKALNDRVDQDSKNGKLFGSRDSMRRGIERALAKGDLTNAFFDGPAWKEFHKRLETRFGEAGRRAGHNLAAGLAETGDFKAFDRRLKDILGEVHRATRQIRDEEQKALVAENRSFKKRISLVGALERELAKLTRPRHDLFGAKETKRIEDHVKALVKSIKDEGTSAETASRKMRLLLRAEEEMKRASDDLESGFARMDRRLRGIGKDRNFFRNGLRDVKDFERRLSGIDKKVRDLKIGRLFGEGSRNNFFNILGKITGALAEFVLLAGVRATRAVVGLGSGFRQADGFMGKFTFTMRILEGIIPKLVVAVLGVGAGLGALQLVGGPIAALISTLSGAVTSLASTIGLGLVGGIGAALPLMGVMGASMGVIALAFAKGGKTTAQWHKDISKVLGPVTSQFHKLQDAARAGLFPQLNKAAPLLAKTLQRLDPLITKVGRGLGQAFTGFLKNLEGPQFKKNLASMEKFFPEAIRKLGTVATNVFGGIAGLMRALVPIANQLLRSWVQGTKNFRAFTNSAHGQNVLSNWFQNAYDSGRKLWRFVKDLGKVLFDLLNLGQPTGNNIFDSMNKSLETFDRWLRSGSGRLAVHKWLDDSRAMLTHLGNFVAGIAHLFGRLASGGGGSLNGIFDALGKFADLIAAALPTIQSFLHDAGKVVGVFLDGLIGIAHFMSAHPDLFGPLIASLGAVWAAWKLFTIGGAIATGFKTIAGALTLGIANTIATITRGSSQLDTAKQKLSVAMAGIGVAALGIGIGTQVGGGAGAAISIGGGALGGAIAGSTFGPIGTGVGAAVGAIVGGLTSMWSSANKAAEAAQQKQQQVVDAIAAASERLKSTLTQDANAIRQLSRTQIASDLSQAMPGQTMSALQAALTAGIDPKKLVDAVSGDTKLFGAINTNIGLKIRELNSARHNFLLHTDPNTRADVLSGIRPDSSVPALAKIDAQLQALKVVQDAIGKENLSVKNAIHLQDLISASAGTLTLATRDAKTEFLAYGKALKGVSVNAQRNRQFIKDHTDALSKDAAKALAAKKPIEDVARGYLHGAQNLAQQLRQAGFMGPAVDNLIAKYGALPKSVITKLEADGTDAAKKIAINLFKLGLIPPSVLTKILGKDEASPIIGNVVANLSKVHDKTVAIKAIKVPGFDSYIQQVVDSINNRTAFIHVGVDRTGSSTQRAVGARGMMINRATKITAGEAGLEALVPMNRPLNQVDPSVRWLSAIAQGLDPGSSRRMASGGIVAPASQRIVNIEAGAVQMVTSTTDPKAAAAEVVDRLAAKVNS